jgi:hypothetical protein
MFFCCFRTEESCTGDPAKEQETSFCFKCKAMMNIEVLNGYAQIQHVLIVLTRLKMNIQTGVTIIVIHHTEVFKIIT